MNAEPLISGSVRFPCGCILSINGRACEHGSSVVCAAEPKLEPLRLRLIVDNSRRGPIFSARAP